MVTSAIATLSDRRKFIAGAGIAAVGVALPFVSEKPAGLVAKPAPIVLPAASASPARPDQSKPRLFPRAMAALDTHAPRIAHRDRIGIVDFAQASREPRFHLVDLASGDVTTHLVAHGRGSDPDRSGWVQRLSNQPDSNASSRGAYLTGPTYVGKHGKSRRLFGLDPDNDMAERRAIVIHGASYVSEAMASAQGLIGRSQGCFAFAQTAIDEVLERLGPGRLLFAWK
jgi:hypothetical protein